MSCRARSAPFPLFIGRRSSHRSLTTTILRNLLCRRVGSSPLPFLIRAIDPSTQSNSSSQLVEPLCIQSPVSTDPNLLFYTLRSFKVPLMIGLLLSHCPAREQCIARVLVCSCLAFPPRSPWVPGFYYMLCRSLFCVFVAQFFRPPPRPSLKVSTKNRIPAFPP